MRMNEAATGERPAELRPQAAHVDVDGAIALPVRTAPDRLVELLARHHPLGVVRELAEELQLPHRQDQWAAVDERSVVGGPDLQTTGIDRRRVKTSQGNRRSR